MSAHLTIDGQPVPLTGELRNGISSYNYFADVTSLVKAKIDGAPPGAVPVTVGEPEPGLAEGEILEVIFEDPSVHIDQTITILYGGLSPAGDTYRVQLASPISLTDPATHLEMSLGISYSYQSGAQQYSTVDVNGQRLTTSAGGEDDGLPHNGALLTVGDNFDSLANPPQPQTPPTEPRSDDERYDLRPFVSTGDKSIQVQTSNPSSDDNVFVATFTMNPPVTQVSTGKKFVYVALGDSYSSGEGAAFDLHPQSKYLEDGYENGHNLPIPAAEQENTYQDGNKCHRALLNYAKINRDKLAPDSQVVLIDRTCSGAKIESGGKPPVTGEVTEPDIAAHSQVQQALDRLTAQNINPADVDLVTVGMGGNDARFGDIVMACVVPALVAELVDRYPNPPGEIQFLVDHVLNCERVDAVLRTDAAIAQLAAKEVHAQRLILQKFPNARVLQVDYPNILPVKDSPKWCGGLRGGDVGFARKKIKKIDSAISVAAGQVSDPRLTLVKQEKTFGDNALCPGDDGRRLANGLKKANVDREVDRLLNEPAARGKLDALVNAYRALKSCIANNLNPFDGSSCDRDQKTRELQAKADDVLKHLTDNKNVIMANIVSPPGGNDDSQATAVDRASGLFHPNANGFAVQACNLLDAWRSTSSNCTTATAPPIGSVNGQPITNRPVTVVVRQLIQVLVNGFLPQSSVRLRLFSQPVDVGTAKVDGNGAVSASFTMPELSPGVHTLEIEGTGAGGVQVTRQVLLNIPGRPTQDYATYLCCFLPEPSTIEPDAPQEEIAVSLGGISLGTYYPDEYGGILVHVPSVDRLRDTSELALEARSNLTGKLVRELLNPIPTAPSLWATSNAATAVTISGSGFSAAGRVHSEGGIQVTGSGSAFRGGVEYGIQLKTSGGASLFNPPAVKTPTGQGRPPVPSITDYRPGGAVQASGQKYRAIPVASCRNGVWTPTAKDVSDGVIYVPCGVALTGIRTFPATIAAEGPISVSGSGVVVGPTTAGSPSLVTPSSSDSAMTVQGSGITLRGTAYAPNGRLKVEGSGFVLQCGAVAATISLTGSGGLATLGSRCLTGS